MLDHLIDIAKQAGQLVLAIYDQASLQITYKEDNSALTEADTASHLFISNSLKKLYPDIPILSEESSTEHDFAIRKNWQYFFLVDPLDGTKEFIQRNGEFTINIALIKHNEPVLGIIHAPILDITYYAEKNNNAYKMVGNKITKLSAKSKPNNKICVVTSRSHACQKIQTYLEKLKSKGNDISITTIGSSLKFGLIADGSADIYPRLAPTMEWDTAAGQVIVSEVGKQVKVFGSNELLKYNKTSLINSEFIVE